MLTSDGSIQPADDLAPFLVLLPEVRAFIGAHAPVGWNAFGELLRAALEDSMAPAVLPLAACAAAGGDARMAVPVAAAWTALNLGARVLDDLEDGDRDSALWVEIGAPRAFNFSAALFAYSVGLLTAAQWPAQRSRDVVRLWVEQALGLAAGQDRDLLGHSGTLDDYWRTIEDKNARAFALACAAGAAGGAADAGQVAACAEFGRHLGLAQQLLDDLQGYLEPESGDDLAQGKLTLPVLYGCTVEHARRGELQRIVARGDLGRESQRVRSILDALPVREFAVWAALEERKLAVAALAECKGAAGVAALHAWIDALFAGLEAVDDHVSR